jgi:ferredoxin-NADP reductase/Na+-translocating ferredoxin:NAD+ oxidoreductase RnfD subunit
MKKLITFIDNTISQITMYRMVMYGLIGTVATGFILSVIGLVHFSAIGIVMSLAILLAICYVINKLFTIVFSAQSNYESWLITALILTLILPPVQTATDASFVALAGLIAIASKYLIVYRHRHIFNPAAFGAVVLTLTGWLPAIWWVGTPLLVIYSAVFGIILLRKLRRYSFFLVFTGSAIVVALVVGLTRGQIVSTILSSLLLSSPLIFFATIMLTEPETMPNGLRQKWLYAILVGILVSSQLHSGPFYTTPELSLIIGNIFAFIFTVGRYKQQVRLKGKIEIGTNLHEYVFETMHSINFVPGQYMEMTLPHRGTDRRGNRRTFSMSSAPQSNEIRFATKSFEKSSSFKTDLAKLKLNDVVTIGQLNGTFILPATTEKLVWVAGGIGITPFISMARDMIVHETRRDVVLFYLFATVGEYAYQDVWKQAKQYGLRIVPILTGPANQNWKGLVGKLTSEVIQHEVPDFKQRHFYLSGPHGLVQLFNQTLRGLSLKKSAIHSDFFSGY